MLYIWTAPVLFARICKSSEFIAIIRWQINALSGYTDTPQTYAIVTFRKIRRKSNFAQVGTDCMYGEPCSCLHMQGRVAKIQTLAHWNVIGRSMTAPRPMLSPSSILPPFIPARKNPTRLKYVII